MRYFAQTPDATAALIRGLADVTVMAVVFVALLVMWTYGPELWTGLYAWIAHALRTVFAVGANQA